MDQRMNDIERLLAKLRVVWSQQPDWRLGQLVVNAMQPPTPTGVFHYPDDRIENGLDRIISRHTGTA